MNNLKKILLVGLSTAMLLQSVAFAQPVTDFRFKSDYNVTLEGYGDSEDVGSGENITRAQLANLLYRTFSDETKASYFQDVNTFTDTDKDAWYNDAVSTLANANVLYGYRCGKFKPDKNVKRAELVAILSRFISYDDYEDNCTYTDINGHWCENDVKRAYSEGWINTETDKFGPEDIVTREEAINTINSFLDYVNDI